MRIAVHAEQMRWDLDKASMRDYIRSVHIDDADGCGFIVWAEKRSSGAWRQKGYKWADLLQHVRKMDTDGKNNLYLSLQTFCAPFRRAETLFRLNAIGYDIDFHHKQAITPEYIMSAFHDLEIRVFNQNILPPPSLAIFTGRGLQLLYLLESLPKQGLPLWKLVGEAMADRLREGLSSTASVVMGELDANYSDTTRVLRIPGTYNTEAKRYSHIIDQDDLPPMRYRLDGLRDAYLPELMPKLKTAKPLASPREKKLISLYNTFSLHMARLDDVVTLREMRKATDLPEDCRRRMVFLYRYWSCFCVGTETALEAAQAFNRGFMCPLPEKTVQADTESAERAYAKWQEDRKKGYNYRNTTLIELLGITLEEQRGLKTIIGAEVKTERQKAKGWYHDKRDKARTSNKQARDGQILALHSTGVAIKEIVRITGIARNTVRRIIAGNCNF